MNSPRTRRHRPTQPTAPIAKQIATMPLPSTNEIATTIRMYGSDATTENTHTTNASIAPP
jgi:hypothetical protein